MSLDGAHILAQLCALPVVAIEALGESDRSATGFLPPPEFEQMANRFFSTPDVAVRGWERA